MQIRTLNTRTKFGAVPFAGARQTAKVSVPPCMVFCKTKSSSYDTYMYPRRHRNSQTYIYTYLRNGISVPTNHANSGGLLTRTKLGVAPFAGWRKADSRVSVSCVFFLERNYLSRHIHVSSSEAHTFIGIWCGHVKYATVSPRLVALAFCGGAFHKNINILESP